MRALLLVTLLATGVSACGASPASPPAAPPAAPPSSAATVSAPPASAPAGEPSLASKIDPLFAKLDADQAPGCSVGVYHAGEIVFEKGYGYANLEWGGKNTPTTPIYLASMSKQFTAASTLLLVGDGKLARTDDVRKYIPELPDYGKVITVENLLHHTGGVRDYGLLLGLSGREEDDLATTKDVLSLLSRQKRLNFAPGTEFSYTNSGYVLLGEIVARVSGMTLAEFEKERIFAPLAMTSTFVKDDYTRVVPGRAAGYAMGKDKTVHFAMGHSQIVGQGNILSTIRDLAKWDANFYEPKIGGQALIDAMRVRGVLTDGTKLGYAGGLEEDVDPSNGLPREQHNGGVNGYRTTMVRYPTARTTVAILCNTGDVDPDELAADVSKVLLPGAPDKTANPPTDAAVKAPAPSSPIDPAIAGLYVDRDAAMVRFLAIEGGTLRVRRSAEGTGGLALTATTPNVFVAEGGTSYTFSPGKRDKGKEPARVVRKTSDGPATTLVRVESVAPLSAAALEEYAGRYGSEEVFRDSEVVARGGALVMRSWGSPDEDTHLKPVARDYLLADGAGFSFERDKRGKVTGVVISDERTRGVRLTRRP